MEVTCVLQLCQYLISSAFQRCRVSEDLARLSVVLKRSPPPDSPFLVRISISDTGIGSSLEEFQVLKYIKQVDIDTDNKWDGVLYVRTTGTCDAEVIHYKLTLKESNSRRRLTMLPSNPKNGVKFSGTEVYLSIFESIDVFSAEIKCFFQKMLILNIPNVAFELVAEHGDGPGTRHENVFLANEFNPLPFSASNVERLMSGLEGYILKHGNRRRDKCESCFPRWEHRKIGRGIACFTESRGTTGLVAEAVVIISEFSATPCIMACSARSELLYFMEFVHCSISKSSVNALTSMDWKGYGLNLGSIVDQGGYTWLEWEDLPPCARIDIAIHCHHDHKDITVPTKQNTRPDRNLLRKATKLALDDLKEKYAGILLSAHALKICSYAPDLARSIAGLILSSRDLDFQGECFSLLGLQSQEIDTRNVEDYINEKIVSVIERNDRKPSSKETAPFLFEDDCLPVTDFHGEEYEEGAEDFPPED